MNIFYSQSVRGNKLVVDEGACEEEALKTTSGKRDRGVYAVPARFRDRTIFPRSPHPNNTSNGPGAAAKRTEEQYSLAASTVYTPRRRRSRNPGVGGRRLPVYNQSLDSRAR